MGRVWLKLEEGHALRQNIRRLHCAWFGTLKQRLNSSPGPLVGWTHVSWDGLVFPYHGFLPMVLVDRRNQRPRKAPVGKQGQEVANRGKRGNSALTSAL
jgi:hypothetical protein